MYTTKPPRAWRGCCSTGTRQRNAGRPLPCGHPAPWHCSDPTAKRRGSCYRPVPRGGPRPRATFPIGRSLTTPIRSRPRNSHLPAAPLTTRSPGTPRPPLSRMLTRQVPPRPRRLRRRLLHSDPPMMRSPQSPRSTTRTRPTRNGPRPSPCCRPPSTRLTAAAVRAPPGPGSMSRRSNRPAAPTG